MASLQPKKPAPFEAAVYALVARIPPGQVATYGQIATYLGSPRGARAVGWALARLQGSKVPWQRVVNAEGGISVGGHPGRPDRQRLLLQREGIRFNKVGQLSLKIYRWDGGGEASL